MAFSLILKYPILKNTNSSKRWEIVEDSEAWCAAVLLSMGLPKSWT